MSFLLCPSCSRHAKATEVACPFCGGELAAAVAQGDPSIKNARSRSRLLFGAAAAAVAGATAVTGCSSSSTYAPPYGQPPHDSGVAADAGTASGDDGGGVAPAYGAPAYGGAAIDSGTD